MEKPKRYFYRDPGDAAYMMRHFDMKMRRDNGEEVEKWMPLEEAMDDMSRYGRFNVVSTKLLQPQEGDLVTLIISSGGSHLGWYHPEGEYILTGSPPMLRSDGRSYEVIEILKRSVKGKDRHFISPEWEYIED